MPHLPPELASAAQSVGLRITSVLRRTDKTLLATGDLAGVRVAVKYCLDPDPFWTAKWRHELDVYRVFADAPPPVPVPRLLYTDGTRLLVLEWLTGRPLDQNRYPDRVLNPAEIDSAVQAVTALNHWSAPASRFVSIFDYRERIDRYHGKGYLTDDDRDALIRLLGRCGGACQLNHGDPLPSNILVDLQLTAGDAPTEWHGRGGLLDWEFAGLFVPGFDLAMLYTLLGARTPDIRTRIDAIVEQSGAEDAFAVNLATVLTRELRIHRELPEEHIRHDRLPVIEAAWTEARERLRRRAIRRT